MMGLRAHIRSETRSPLRVRAAACGPSVSALLRSGAELSAERDAFARAAADLRDERDALMRTYTDLRSERDVSSCGAQRGGS